MLLSPHATGMGTSKNIRRVFGQRSLTMDCAFMADAGILVFIERGFGDDQIDYARSDASKN